MNVRTIVLFFILICVSFIYAQEIPVDLNKAVQSTLEKNALIKQLSSQADVVDARVSQLKSNYLPSVDADVTYARIGPVPTFEFGALSAQLYPENNYDAHVNLGYTVYDFGKRDALLNVTGSGKITALDNVEMVKSNLAYQVIQVFYSILYMKESIKVKDEQLNNLNSHLQNTIAKVKAGTATDYDELTTRVKISAVQNQKIDIQNEINKQEIQLKSLMGLAPAAPINVTGTFNFTPLSFNPDSLTGIALSERSELKIARDNEKTAELQILNAKKNDMPALNFHFMYGFKNGFIPNLDAFRGNFTAALNFRYPIYNGSKTDYLEQEANANLSSAKSHNEDLETGVRAEVSKALSDLSSLQRQLDNINVQIEQASQSVQRSELQYRAGTLGNLDLLDAQTNFSEARLSELQIIFRNILAYYNLQHAIGKKVWETNFR